MIRGSSWVCLTLAYIAFISLGLPDTVLGVGWPGIRSSFGLSQSNLGFIVVSGAGGYFITSFLSGRLLQILGIGTLLTFSSLLVATGLAGCAMTTNFAAFLICCLVIGLGSGAIDSAMNTFASNNFSARHMNWLHAFWAVGASVGPMIMTGALVKYGAWQSGYLIIHLVLMALAILFGTTRKLWNVGERSGQSSATSQLSVASVLKAPLVRLQIAFFAVYPGVEAVVGLWNFTISTEIRMMSVEEAGLLSSLYWGGLMVGRFTFGGLMEKFGGHRLISLALAGTILGQLLFVIGGEGVSAVGLVLTGISLAPLFPTLMSQTPARLGERFALHAIGFQVSAAMIGVMFFPTIAALIADKLGPETVMVMTLGCAALLAVLYGTLQKLSPIE